MAQLTRPELHDLTSQLITDDFTRQNTAERVRLVFNELIDSTSNLAEDGQPGTGTGPAPTPGTAFVPLLASELNNDKSAYAGLALRPLLVKLINALGTGTGTTQPVPTITVNAQRVADLSGLAAGEVGTDYEYQLRFAPTVNAQRVADLSGLLAPGETFSDYEYQLR